MNITETRGLAPHHVLLYFSFCETSVQIAAFEKQLTAVPVSVKCRCGAGVVSVQCRCITGAAPVEITRQRALISLAIHIHRTGGEPAVNHQCTGDAGTIENTALRTFTGQRSVLWPGEHIGMKICLVG